MEIKLIIVEHKKHLRFIKLLCFVLTTLLLWGAIFTQPFVSHMVSDITVYLGIICWAIWFILYRNFVDYKDIGELILNDNFIKIQKNDYSLILNQSEIIQVRIFYKNFKKEYEKDGTSVSDQISDTRNINKIKIKSKSGTYHLHFFLEYRNYFDDLYTLIKTMASNGIDIKICPGSNLWTKYLDEKSS